MLGGGAVWVDPQSRQRAQTGKSARAESNATPAPRQAASVFRPGSASAFSPTARSPSLRRVEVRCPPHSGRNPFSVPRDIVKQALSDFPRLLRRVTPLLKSSPTTAEKRGSTSAASPAEPPNTLPSMTHPYGSPWTCGRPGGGFAIRGNHGGAGC